MRRKKSAVSDNDSKGSHGIKRSPQMLRPAQRATTRKVRTRRIFPGGFPKRSRRREEADFWWESSSASSRRRLREQRCALRIAPQNQRARIGVVRFRGAEVLAKKRTDVQDSGREPVGAK